MFISKKNKAIGLLYQQKDKAKNEGGIVGDEWILETKTYMEKFLGPESHFYEYFKNFKLTHADNMQFNSHHKELESVRDVVESAINTIKNTGIYKPTRKNFLSTMDQNALIAGLVVIGGIIIWLANLSADFKNRDLKQTVDQQNQKIQNLQDTIIKLKQENKNTVISLQEPADTIKKTPEK